MSRCWRIVVADERLLLSWWAQGIISLGVTEEQLNGRSKSQLATRLTSRGLQRADAAQLVRFRWDLEAGDVVAASAPSWPDLLLGHIGSDYRWRSSGGPFGHHHARTMQWHGALAGSSVPRRLRPQLANKIGISLVQGELADYLDEQDEILWQAPLSYESEDSADYSWPTRAPASPPTKPHRKPKAASEDEPLDPDEALLDATVRPRGKGQGFRVDLATKLAVEDRAMKKAIAALKADGWQVSDVSKKKNGHDLECSRGQERREVEVKGTTGDGSQVIVTRNEVERAQDQKVPLDLCVVSNIKVVKQPGGSPKPSGGSVRWIKPWTPDEHDLRALAYRHTIR